MLATAFTASSKPVHLKSAPVPSRCSASDPLADHLVAGPSLTFDAQEHIFREGDPVSYIYKVEAGHVCVYRMMSDGRRQVIDFAFAGDIVGLGALGTHTANAQATIKSRLRRIPTSALHEAMRTDQRLGSKLYEAMSWKLLAARELLFAVSQRTATERLAGFLLALSRRNERRGEDASEIVLPMSRIDIADYLGLTIETVSRTFSKFRAAGLIDIEQCILVTICDAQALAAVADGTREVGA